MSQHDTYLTLVPGGLYDVAVEWLQAQLTPQWHLETRLMASRPLASPPPKKQHAHLVETCCPPAVDVATFSHPQYSQNVSVGYHGDKPVWTQAGATFMIWMRVETNAPVSVVASLRGPGPWLAWVGGWPVDLPMDDTPESYVPRIAQVLTHDEGFTKALDLWRRFALSSSWEKRMPAEQRSRILQGNDFLKYRISCMREDSKRYSYNRQDFVKAIAGSILPSSCENWKVDLTNYDVEVVLLVKNQSYLAMALTLQPFQLVTSKNFGNGSLPPDLLAPLPDFAPQDVTRLRTSNAQLLLQLCQLQPGEVLLDPCVGVGTLAAEASRVVSLGGDLVLTADGLGSVAAAMSRSQQPGPDLLCAWDASVLPIRNGSVDVICSDLPFGHQCMSAAKVQALLPLLVAEMARVLRPSTGRMVLLCGSYAHVLEALIFCQKELPRKEGASGGGTLWKFPCTAVFPVNIGGISAWIVMISRGDALWEHERLMQRIRKQVAKRQLVLKQQAGIKKKKRLQA